MSVCVSTVCECNSVTMLCVLSLVSVLSGWSWSGLRGHSRGLMKEPSVIRTTGGQQPPQLKFNNLLSFQWYFVNYPKKKKDFFFYVSF